MPLYVTPPIVPVSPAVALMRMPLVDLVTVEDEKVTLLTVLSSRPPTEPIERPWPPEQRPEVKVISCEVVSDIWAMDLALILERRMNLQSRC